MYRLQIKFRRRQRSTVFCNWIRHFQEIQNKWSSGHSLKKKPILTYVHDDSKLHQNMFYRLFACFSFREFSFFSYYKLTKYRPSHRFVWLRLHMANFPTACSFLRGSCMRIDCFVCCQFLVSVKLWQCHCIFGICQRFHTVRCLNYSFNNWFESIEWFERISKCFRRFNLTNSWQTSLRLVFDMQQWWMNATLIFFSYKQFSRQLLKSVFFNIFHWILMSSI